MDGPGEMEGERAGFGERAQAGGGVDLREHLQALFGLDEFRPAQREVVEEANCISRWGHEFRPEYNQLAEVRRLLGTAPRIALTATATADVRKDIVSGLGMGRPKVYVTGFDRLNLAYESRSVAKVRDKE